MRPSKITRIVQALFENQYKYAVCLWGPRGIGKSSIPKTIARNMNVKLFDIRVAQIEAVDAKGMPFAGKEEIFLSKDLAMAHLSRLTSPKIFKDMVKKYLPEFETDILNVSQKVLKNVEAKKQVLDLIELEMPEYVVITEGVLKYYSPDWIIKAANEHECIVFFDEFNRAHADVWNSLFELIYDKVNNGIHLKNMHVLSANNPPSSRYNVQSMSEDALIGRFVHIFVEADYNDWSQWALEYNEDTGRSNIHPLINQFIKSKPSAYFMAINKEDPTCLSDFMEIQYDPRRHEFISEFQYIVDKTPWLKTDKDALIEMYAGISGVEWAQSYMQWLETAEFPLDLQEILNMTPEIESKIDKYLLLDKKQNVASSKIRGNAASVPQAENEEETYKIHLLTDAISELVTLKKCFYISKETNFHVVPFWDTEEKRNNIAKFLTKIPEDMGIRFYRTLLNVNSMTESFVSKIKGNDANSIEKRNNAVFCHEATNSLHKLLVSQGVFKNIQEFKEFMNTRNENGLKQFTSAK